MLTTHDSPLTTLWGLIDDRPGHANQVRGLVEAMSQQSLVVSRQHDEATPLTTHHSPLTTEISLSYNALSHLPNALLGATIGHLTPAARAALSAPWPALVIACGRRTEPVARWIKAQSPTTRIAYIMKPASPMGWDAVIMPAHDRPTDHRSSIIDHHTFLLTTHGPLHRITPDALDAARLAWEMRFAALPTPRIGVLMGDVSPRDAHAMLTRAAALAGDTGSLLISTSRRTPRGLLPPLLAGFTCPHDVFDWHTPSGENPYLGILASADRLIVSGDSLSMCVEAVASSVPTHIASWPSLPAKHRALHAMLFAQGHALTLDAKGTTTTPTNDTLLVAEALKNRFFISP